MLRNLCIAVTAAFLLGGGALPQERNERALILLKGISKARYTLVEGILRAQRKVRGRVLAAKMDVERGEKGIQVTYEVLILRGNGVFRVEVDGISGMVIKVERKGRLFQREEGEKGERAEREGGRRERESRGEHDRERGSSGREEGEESGRQVKKFSTLRMVRNGVQLIMAYHPKAHAFLGTIENITGRTLKRVRVEVHLSNGKELGPTGPVTLGPGKKRAVRLEVESTDFSKWSAHPEVGSGEHCGRGEKGHKGR